LNGYQHQRGVHCGSTALRNLFAGRGFALSEPMIFGLGAGLGFARLDGPRDLTPPMPERLFIGRSLAYEQDLCAITGALLEVLRFETGAQAFAAARARLEAGLPILAFVDLFHLPYMKARGHWFGHLIALVGMQDENTVLVSDNERETLEPVQAPVLQRAFSSASAGPDGEKVLLSVLEVRPMGREALRDACSRAIQLQGDRLRSPPTHLDVWQGTTYRSALEAVRGLPEEIRSWKDTSDLARRLRFAAQVIEVRGNGGGLFRRIYAQFLEEAAVLGVPGAAALKPLVGASADAFTALAAEFVRARDALSANSLNSNHLEIAAHLAETIVIAEERFVAAI